MTTLTITRDRRDLLNAITAGRIVRTFKGTILRQVRAGQNRRCDRAVRELETAGLAELGPDGRTYQLTGIGRAAREVEQP